MLHEKQYLIIKIHMFSKYRYTTFTILKGVLT